MALYRCAVIGNPIAHSRSPAIHAEFARQRGIDLQYDRILAEKDTFPAVVKDFFTSGGRGLNITVPFKAQAFQLCTRYTEYAERAEAVNTLWQENGQLYGDNTDGRGLVEALRLTRHCTINNQRILLIGAGGAARGVLFPLLAEQPAALVIMNRTYTKGAALAQKAANPAVSCLPYGMSTEQPFDIVINATSAGLSKTSFSLPATTLHPESLCYDMVYGKITPFMQWAEKRGCRHIADGYTMLKAQARLSFNQWFGQ